jgi:hypothetical protein
MNRSRIKSTFLSNLDCKISKSLFRSLLHYICISSIFFANSINSMNDEVFQHSSANTSPSVEFEYEQAGLDSKDLTIIKNAFAGLGALIKSEEGFGVDSASGLVQDNVYLDINRSKIISEPAGYTAPSKWGVYAPFLLKIIQKHPLAEKTGIKQVEALSKLKKMLESLQNFQQSGEGKETLFGLFGWVSIQPGGILKNAPYEGRRMVPSLDNGQFSEALRAIDGYGFLAQEMEEKHPGIFQKEILELILENQELAHRILSAQRYEKMIDPATGHLFAEMVILDGGQWQGFGKPGHPSIWTEWEIPMRDLVLRKIISKESWLSFGNDTFKYLTPHGVIDVPQGYIQSVHEFWGLIYNHKILKKSKLFELYVNNAYVVALYMLENDMPGAPATEYSNLGTYVQSGIPLTALKRGGKTAGHIDSPLQSTLYGTAILSLIDISFLKWVAHFLKHSGVTTAYGPVSSFMSEGEASRIITADSAFVAAVATMGGVSDEVLAHYKHRYQITEDDFVNIYDIQADSILSRLGNKKFHSINPALIPSPPNKIDYTVKKLKMEKMSAHTMDISKKMKKGDWHGVNVSIPKEAIKEYHDCITQYQGWVLHNGLIWGDYDLQKGPFAYMGATLESPFSIVGAKYISLWVRIGSDENWHLELKSGRLLLANRINVTTKDGCFPNKSCLISEDGQWVRLIYPFQVNDNVHSNLFTAFYISTNETISLKSKGQFYLKDVQIHTEEPR